jgi:RNA polymerase subunit RPABC4/transcription elongation factor Spt4
MMEEGHKDIFLSCFKCGRIVKSSDSECPRCGLQFGPGTLFECPFCCGLIWRNATVCSTCGIDLAKFSENVEKSSEGFDMDEFVDNIITNELKDMKASVRRVACPGCGLMIRGDEERCPRCDLPLEEAQVDCPVCGEKLPLSAKACTNCQAMLAEPPVEGELRPPEEEAVAEILGVKTKPPKQAKAKPVKKAEPPKKKVEKKAEKKPEKKPEKRAKAKKPS